MRHTKLILCCGFCFLSSLSVHAQLFPRNKSALAEIVAFQLRQQKESNQPHQPVNSILKNLFSPVSELNSQHSFLPVNFPRQRLKKNDVPIVSTMPSRPVLINKETSPYKKWLKKKKLREKTQVPNIFTKELN